MRIGFIGTGIMGSSMAGHLLAAENEMYVYNRTKSKAQSLIKNGATWMDSPRQIAEICDVIFTIVGYPCDVEEVYLDEKSGLLAHVKKDCILIDMTTSTPELAMKLSQIASEKGCFVLDAPVTGGDVGAKNATLTIFVGGEQSAYNNIKNLLDLMGKNVNWMGRAGNGQHAKMCNQIAIAANMIGVCESIAYAKKSGLDVAEVVSTISQGAAGSWSLSNYGPRIISGDYEPGFFIKHFIKDMKIALDEAERMNLDLPGLKLAKNMYEELAEKGLDNKGTQALELWYSDTQ